MKSPFRWKKSVHSSLFSSYVLLIFVSGLFFTVFSNIYTAGVLRKNAIESFRDLAASVTAALDAELKKMNNVSINLAFSDSFSQLVTNRLAIELLPESQDEQSQKYRNAAELVDVMGTIIGAFKLVPQVNFYDLRGEMIGAGVYSQAALLDFYDIPWLEDIDLTTGAKKFSPPHTDPLLEKIFPLYSNQTYISLYRPYFDKYQKPLGVIEVKQFTDTIFRSLTAQTRQVLVFDGDGTLLFPIDTDENYEDYKSVIQADDEMCLTYKDPATGKTRIATVRSSEESSWRIVISQDEGTLLQPVRIFTKLIITSSILFCLAAILIASRLSRQLTIPLKAMHEQISSLDWDAVSSGKSREIASELNELEELQLAFQNMQTKLKESMDEVLEARTHEIRATMLALQSQMDPHFIYNMLTTIGIMAEEGMMEEITGSVEHLTHLLRYISSGKSSVVTIKEEIEYARRYLTCMKIRFRDKLTFDISLPEDLGLIQVPRLIIQPIIENTMKYGTTKQPPWHISIEGKFSHGHWRIRIRDNGPGFDDKRLKNIKSEIRTYMKSGPDPYLQISGMGLINISCRMRLFYGDEAVFSLENNKDGGASIVIGGTKESRIQI